MYKPGLPTEEAPEMVGHMCPSMLSPLPSRPSSSGNLRCMMPMSCQGEVDDGACLIGT